MQSSRTYTSVAYIENSFIKITVEIINNHLKKWKVFFSTQTNAISYNRGI